MSHSLLSRCLLCASLGMMSLVAWAEAPVAKWVATAENTTNFPNVISPEQAGRLHNADILWKTEDLIDHPSAWFNGEDSFVEIANTPALNPKELTLSVWFKLPDGVASIQKPLAVKSALTHTGAMYQYGLFIADNADHPNTVIFYLGIGGKLSAHVVNNAPMHNGWNKITATYDGKFMKLYCNGVPLGEDVSAVGAIDAYDTPLLFGAYGNLEKNSSYCYQGYISEVALYDAALSPKQIKTDFMQESKDYPKAGEAAKQSSYARHLNAALEEDRDVWGEALMA